MEENVVRGEAADGAVVVTMDGGRVDGVRLERAWRAGADAYDIQEALVDAFNSALNARREALATLVPAQAPVSGHELRGWLG